MAYLLSYFDKESATPMRRPLLLAVAGLVAFTAAGSAQDPTPTPAQAGPMVQESDDSARKKQPPVQTPDDSQQPPTSQRGAGGGKVLDRSSLTA